MRRVYQSDDLQCLGTEDEVRWYEYNQKNPLHVRLENVRHCYSVRTLLEKYPENTSGFWEIRGEDPNCDLGDYHRQPYIATVRGSLLKAMEYAAQSPQFFGGGAGGLIQKIDVLEL